MDKPRPFAEVIAELTRLDAAATPGPWGVDADGEYSTVLDSDGGHVTTNDYETGIGCLQPDAQIIAAMRNALPVLLARAAVFEAAVAWDDVRQSVDDDGADSVSLVRRMIEREKDLRAAIARALAAENQPRAELGEETK